MMEVGSTARIELQELARDPDGLRREILHGLGKPAKELPSKLFYDPRGAALFERICQLDEYYLTRTETAILERHAPDIAAGIGAGVLLVELGSGSSAKTRILLDHLRQPAGYVPIDLSREQLQRSAAAIADAYPHLAVLPLLADYTQGLSLPPIDRAFDRIACFFSGSTIGNFRPRQAVAFLRRIRRLVRPAGALLIGVDLKKDPQLLHRAYNDRAGVTAEFNLNILAHVNRLLGADFQLDQFEHQAHYDQRLGRIEMHLISRVAQQVHLGGRSIPLRAGERILTEVSYKYDPQQFAGLARQAGFRLEQAWSDEHQYFSVQLMRAA